MEKVCKCGKIDTRLEQENNYTKKARNYLCKKCFLRKAANAINQIRMVKHPLENLAGYTRCTNHGIRYKNNDFQFGCLRCYRENKKEL